MLALCKLVDVSVCASQAAARKAQPLWQQLRFQVKYMKEKKNVKFLLSSILEIEPCPREVITTFQYLSKNRPALEKQSPHSNVSLLKLVVVCRNRSISNTMLSHYIST